MYLNEDDRYEGNKENKRRGIYKINKEKVKLGNHLFENERMKNDYCQL